MKRIFGLVLMLAATQVFSQNYTGDSWAQVKAKGEGTISLAYVETFGLVYKENGKIDGLCVAIMNEFVKFVNEKKGVKLTSQFVGEGDSFKGMYDKVKNSKGGVFGL